MVHLGIKSFTLTENKKGELKKYKKWLKTRKEQYE